ncbi:MAG: DUF5674 family protein [Patescibacteria group bacterium]|nr:hypothetical protein [Patescibacteria group bacterium]MBU2509650.1 hypothetical protein [Patescibacteria group bacterium]
MRIIIEPISLDELQKIAEERFGDMVKAVVDVQKQIMAIGGELHADEEALLLEQGSKQDDLWGINIYPDEAPEKQIEFDSMINLRPRQGNRSRSVEDAEIRRKIEEIVRALIK